MPRAQTSRTRVRLLLGSAAALVVSLVALSLLSNDERDEPSIVEIATPRAPLGGGGGEDLLAVEEAEESSIERSSTSAQREVVSEWAEFGELSLQGRVVGRASSEAVEGARVPGRRAGETRFCLAAFLRSASQLVAPAENRWRRRAARGERASAGPVSTRGDWRSLGRGPGVRVDGTARATSQSAKPRSWRRPSPPPQPTQPAPAQTACSDGEVGRAGCARQTRARQHGAVMHARRAMSGASPERRRPFFLSQLV